MPRATAMKQTLIIPFMKSKTKILAAILCAAVSAFPFAGSVAQITIVPQPRQVRLNPGKATLPANPKVYIDSKAKISADYVTAQLKETGLTPVLVKKASQADIAITLNAKEATHAEGYELNVTDKGTPAITATAHDRSGAVYALETIRQLLKKEGNGFSAAVCKISDWPEFGWRSMLLDESRHFHGSAMVKRLLDEMVRLKMNTFHWHLVDDPGWRLEIKGYPKLTEVGSLSDFSHWFPGAEEWKKIYPERERSYYTQDEIREIVEYAAERGIRILPEIEVPAHCTAATKAYPELLTPVDNGNENLPALYNVISPEYEKFIHDVLDQVIKLFDAKVIHIGGDEANYSRWDNNAKIKAFMKEHGLHTYPDMQLYAINEISKYLDKKGVKMIGWNEITGDNIRNEAGRGENSAIQLKPGTLVQFWDGSTEFAKKAIAKGYEVVNSNRLFTYIDYSYESIPLTRAYSFNPYFDGLTDEQKTKVLGCGCQMWGEATPTDKRIYFQTFPRLAAYAEAGWTPNDLKNYADFVRRIIPIEQTWKQKGYFVGQPSFTMGKTEEPK